jgi:hypothetical protein
VCLLNRPDQPFPLDDRLGYDGLGRLGAGWPSERGGLRMVKGIVLHLP